MIWLRKVRKLYGKQKHKREFLFSKAQTNWCLIWKPSSDRKIINQMWQMLTEDKEN